VAVASFPDSAEARLLARVQLTAASDDASANARESRVLVDAIAVRQTRRVAFEQRAIASTLIADLQAASAAEGAQLIAFEPGPQREALAVLIAKGDRLQHADPKFRRELADWMRPNASRRGDGLPGYALGVGDRASRPGPSPDSTWEPVRRASTANCC